MNRIQWVQGEPNKRNRGDSPLRKILIIWLKCCATLAGIRLQAIDTIHVMPLKHFKHKQRGIKISQLFSRSQTSRIWSTTSICSNSKSTTSGTFSSKTSPGVTSHHSWLTENNLNFTMVDLLDHRTCIYNRKNNNQADPRSGTYTFPRLHGSVLPCHHTAIEKATDSAGRLFKSILVQTRLVSDPNTAILVMCFLWGMESNGKNGIHPSTKNQMRMSKSTCEKMFVTIWTPCFYKNA